MKEEGLMANRRITRASRVGRLLLAIGLLLATVSAIVVTTTVATTQTSAGAASVCADDGASGCTVTLPCATAPCPSIDVSPNSDVSDGEYLFIKARNFDPTGSMRVAICATDSSATDPSCLNGVWENNDWTPIHVPVTADPTSQNLTEVAYPAFVDPANQGNTPIPAHDIVNTEGSVKGFYCDAADPCSMVVTEEPGQGNNVGNGPLVSASNSAVVPLSFSNSSAGCPSSAPSLNTDSSFSLEHFIPAAIDATCSGTAGVVAQNTTTNNQEVISDFAAGGADLAFTDDPSDPSALAELQGKGYSLIPIAVSGTAVSFLAGDSKGGLSFPIANYNLTPNMVAGLITSLYQSPKGSTEIVDGKPKIELSDNLIPPLVCADLTGCQVKKPKGQTIVNELNYNAFDLLNPVSSGVIAPTSFGSFMSNVSSGSSYQVTDWLCNAPNTPYSVSVNEVGQSSPVSVPVTDPNVASSTLTTAPIGSSIWPPPQGGAWVFPTCQGYSTFPALSATANNYSEGSSPAFQAKSMRSWAYGGTSLPQPPNPQSPLAAFGVMDSSEASFYGLSTANMQNAAGKFVAPDPASLEAAADDLTPCASGDLTCPAGTYAVNYDNTDPSAYPMPDITYAVVPTAAQPYSTATAMKDLLTNLVTYSHTAALPAGYAPLPTGMYHTALSEISNDVASLPAPPKSAAGGSGSPGSTGSSGSPSSGTSGSEPGSAASSGLYDAGLTASPLSQASDSSDSPGGSDGKGGSGGQAVGSSATAIPTGFLLVGLDSAARFLLPFLVVLALICLLGGGFLLFGPAAVRRRRARGMEASP